MIRLLAIVLLIISSIGCKHDALPVKKPNVLFILADDLGVHDLGVTGSEFYETPNIDKLANEGFVFTQGYAASRVCSPSRASIFTGKFTARHGITDWIGARSGIAWRKAKRHDKLLPAEYNHALSHSDITLAEAMKENGYKTFFAGKWHLGSEGSSPEDHGFDINIGGNSKGSPIGGYYAPLDNPNLEKLKSGENLTMHLANQTLEFIRDNKDSTFFAFLSFYAVHGPIQTTETKWTKYRAKAEKQGIDESGYKMERVLPIRTVQDNPVYAGLVETMDDAVGVVLDGLATLGLDENTIVIFTSDNGGVASGDSFSTSNLPLRGGKGYQWEGGIKEPYFIKVPGKTKNAFVSDEPVIGTDFYPTILELIGAQSKPEQHMDGLSLVPLMDGSKIADRPLIWHYPHYGNQGGNPSSIIRKGDWKLIHYWEDGTNELYNVKTDIEEQDDLASSEREKLMSLEVELMSWLRGVNANMTEVDSTYNESLALARHKNIVEKRWPSLEEQRRDYLRIDWKPNNNWWDSKLTSD